MKTYKRELAVALLVWLVYVVETKDASTIEILVWPVFTFAALAFGLDWFGKSDGSKTMQIVSRGKTSGNVSQTPDDPG
jgi:hypothetical protein